MAADLTDSLRAPVFHETEKSSFLQKGALKFRLEKYFVTGTVFLAQSISILKAACNLPNCNKGCYSVAVALVVM